MFFFQDVAQDPEIQMVLTIELLSINAIYLLVAIRWFFILKLMDLNDMIATKKLQGLTDAEISNDLRYKQILVKYFPQWYKDKQLWSRRAWQGVTKEQIMLRRATNNINVSTTNTTKHDKRYVVGNSSHIHTHALTRLGLLSHENKSTGSHENKSTRALEEQQKKSRQKASQRLLGIAETNQQYLTVKKEPLRRTGGKLSSQKSYRTQTVAKIEQDYTNHRKMQIASIKKQQSNRRSSVMNRVAARKKATAKVRSTNALLKSVYFSNLHNTSISKIIDAMDFVVLEQDDNHEICHQGDVADTFYVIVSGTCQITVDGQPIAVLGELDIFGESSLFVDAKGQSIRNATVTKTVNEHCLQLLTLSRDKFNVLLASGALNEDCINKLKLVADQRAKTNRPTKFGDVLKKAIVLNDVNNVIETSLSSAQRHREKVIKEKNQAGTRLKKRLSKRSLSTASRPSETRTPEQTPETRTPETQTHKHDATNDDVEKHRRLLAKTIQSADTFRRLVLKIGTSMRSLPRERKIDGNTVVGKKMFLVLAKKITEKKLKLTLSLTVKEGLWLSACNSSKRQAETTGVELNGLSCAVLESWLGVK